jgi:S-adenosylmethionine hydrolase
LAIITLTTDFGLRDGNVGVMKGVIRGIAQDVHIIDLSHQISSQNVMEGAFILGRSAPYFPAGCVHIGVVDPGVGTRRRAIAARLGSQYFVGPDNGLFSVMLSRAEAQNWPVAIYHTDKPEYWLPEVSDVFHGRDIFSPVGAHLARGIPLEMLGSRIYDPIRLELPEPEQKDDVWHGQVLHIDHFGNIATNFQREHLADLGTVSVRLCGQEISGLVRTFGEREPGELVALIGSTGYLVVSVVNGDAASRLQAKRGDLVEVIPRN